MAGYLLLPDVKRSADNQIWFRFVQQEDGIPELKIYDSGDNLVKTINGLGTIPEGVYDSRSRAVFWDRTYGGGVLAPGSYVVSYDIDGVVYDKKGFLLL